MQKWPLLLLLLTLVAGAFANIGIGPAQLDLNFDNFTRIQTVTLYAINLGGDTTRVQVSAEGELASFVTFESTNFLLSAGETKPFQATINLPNDYTKGNYELYISVAEVPEGENGTGYAVQSLSSTVVNINQISGATAFQQAPNQTIQTAGQNQTTNETNQYPGGFVILPPQKAPEKSFFEKFTGGFASFLSPFKYKLNALTWLQWVVIGLFVVVFILLYAYIREPGRPQQPQLFAYQPRQQYPQTYYPQQPGYGYRR